MISDLLPTSGAAGDGPSGIAPAGHGSFDRVLLAVDGETDSQVIETAVSVAEAFDASIHALSVVPMRASVDHWDFAVERREAEAERALDRVGEAVGTVPATKRLRYGDPAEEIELYAEHNAIDLVVVGEPERTGLRRWLSPRSVTESIRRSVSIPLLAVPGCAATTEAKAESEALRRHAAPPASSAAAPSDD